MQHNNKKEILRRAAGRGLMAGVLALAVSGFAGCSDNDSDVPAADSDVLQMLPYTSPMHVVTRAEIDGVTVPDNYLDYSELYPQADEQYATIGVFMTPQSTAISSFIYKGENRWSSQVYATNGDTYYIYGFMPKEMAQSASIAKLDGADDYSGGATLSIVGMPVVVASDPSVVVGVQDVAVDVTETDGTTTITPLKGAVRLGVFQYIGKEKGKNFIRLLLDHLYAGVNFCFQVDNTYSELRSIRLRKLEFKCNSYSTVDCAVTVQANTENTNPLTNVAFTGLQTGTSTATVYRQTRDDIEFDDLTIDDGLIPTVTEATAEGGKPLNVLGCFLPSNDGVASSLSIIVTYDVYDKAGNLIREGVTAENKVPGITGLSRGDLHTLTITVIPTYLYQLSDPDLDNPTIKISNQ